MSDDLTVIGGAGGIAVNVEELGQLAATLRGVAGELDAAHAALVVAGIRIAAMADLVPAATARAVAAIEVTAARTAAVSAAADALADGAVAARAGYEGAERSVLGLLLRVIGLPPGGLGTAHPMAGLPGRPLAQVPAPHQLLAPLAAVLDAVPGSGPDVAVEVVGDPGEPAARPAGAEDLIAGIDSLYPGQGGRPGSLEVRRIDQPDGATSWAVLIPGTQSLALRGANPMDNATNVQEYVGSTSAMSVAVVAALGMAGARRGEPVLLAGHSQGGLVAMRVAAEPAVRRRYEVTTVLTAGSPVGHLPSPAGVSVLHLEHTRDVVPALDAVPNPDEPDRTTVLHRGSGPAPRTADARSDAPGRDAPGRASSGTAAPDPRTGAHDAASYARTGALVDGSPHPSVRAWRERAGQALGGEDATATRTVFVVDRM